MSTFITKPDYSSSITDNLLDDITEMDDAVLDAAETEAIGLAKDYLRQRYDVETAFATEGPDRNSQLVKVIVDISLFYSHHRVNPRKIPEHRAKAYERAEKWLKMANKGEIELALPKLETDDKMDFVVYGGNTPRQNHL